MVEWALIFQYFREGSHALTESIKGRLGIKRECDELPRLTIPESATLQRTSIQGSTAGVITALGGCSDKIIGHQAEAGAEQVASVQPKIDSTAEVCRKPASHDDGEDEAYVYHRME